MSGHKSYPKLAPNIKHNSSARRITLNILKREFILTKLDVPNLFLALLVIILKEEEIKLHSENVSSQIYISLRCATSILLYFKNLLFVFVSLLLIWTVNVH